MVMSWNKFCFQEGIAEVRVKLIGQYDQAGLWPAFWMMGNLGRATFKESTEGLWPFIFDECVPPEDKNCRANQCNVQLITKCNPDPGYGLNPYQGRGAPEIDVIEAMPGKVYVQYNDYQDVTTLGCAAPDPATQWRVSFLQVRVTL
eukprot:3849269-Pleurochrysis_carterae.AAC.9